MEMRSRARVDSSQRIAFVQYGDFYVDSTRLGFGGSETYVAQRSSVSIVEQLAHHYAGVMVICLKTGPNERDLPSGVRGVGMPSDALLSADRHQLRRILDSWGPTTVIVQTPFALLDCTLYQVGLAMCPDVGDSFRDNRLRRRLGYWRLSRILNHPSIDFVGNHQVPACQDLARLGVDPDKIIPWDLPSQCKPTDNPAKTSVHSPGQLSVMYVGSVNELKGVGDLIKAIAQFNRSNTKVSATVAGKGDLDHFRDAANRLGVADRINFTGLVPHTRIVPMMQEHDVVVIPSHHQSPEGLPFTIYEALTSRSPLVVSDHPMFLKRLEDGHSALVFPEADSTLLANCLRRLAQDTELYSRLSQNAAETWQRLQIPVLWGDLLDRWLVGGPENIRWLRSHTLSRFKYD